MYRAIYIVPPPQPVGPRLGKPCRIHHKLWIKGNNVYSPINVFREAASAPKKAWRTAVRYVVNAPTRIGQERGREAASPSALSRRSGNTACRRDCTMRKRRKRRAPFARAATRPARRHEQG